jgi:hypothetical protein
MLQEAVADITGDPRYDFLRRRTSAPAVMRAIE